MAKGKNCRYRRSARRRPICSPLPPRTTLHPPFAAEARPGLKVVLTSAYDEKLVRATVGATQACGFIRKPFQVDELVYIVRSALFERATTG